MDERDPRARTISTIRRGSADRIPLLVLHGLQCDVSFARSLAQAMPAEQPIHGFRAVGLNGFEPPLATIEAMAARYLEEARAVVAGGPFLLAGFCAGAAIAKEMAHQVTPDIGRVARLFVIDMARTTETAAFEQVGAAQIAVARRRIADRPRLSRHFGRAPQTVAAYVAALKAYAALPGQPFPYAGPTTIVATRRSLPQMGDPATGWQGTFPDDSVVAVIGDDRDDLIATGLPELGARIFARSRRAAG